MECKTTFSLIPQYIENIQSLINITIKCIHLFLSNFCIFTLYSFIIKYIEGIINLIFTIFNYINYINNNENDVNKINENKLESVHQLQSKENKQYVQVHNWANCELDDTLKYICYKPLRWRPTIINKELFENDIIKIRNNLINKIRKYINSKSKNYNVFENTKIFRKFKNFKNKIIYKLNKYIQKIKNKTIRNKNISMKQIKIIINFNNLYKNLQIMGADKNRGNVIENLNIMV